MEYKQRRLLPLKLTKTVKNRYCRRKLNCTENVLDDCLLIRPCWYHRLISDIIIDYPSKSFEKKNLHGMTCFRKTNAKIFTFGLRGYLAFPSIEIPKSLFNPSSQLHVFTDSSKVANGAAIYFHVCDINQNSCSFLTSRAKIGPIKQISLPKLDLQAGILWACVAHFIENQNSIKTK